MKKETICHTAAGECYYRFVLSSGLTVLCWPVEGYTIAHAVFATDFGSVDRAFSLNGEKRQVPAGVAHFLEHKMFENENGEDAFNLYAKTGASANAFTSFDKTCYVFTASDHLEESLDILLSFVSHPYFTKATVRKEQGIIGQEIKMYDDNPDWRLLFSLLGQMYHTSPVKEDIAGSVESISHITPEILYACTDAFYNPHNMVLSVAGNITPEQVLEACRRAGLCEEGPAPLVERCQPAEEPGVVQRELALYMSVSQPVFGLGFKEEPLPAQARLKGEIVADLLTEVICGDSSPLYRKLYDDGLVNSSFSGDLLSGDGYFSFQFGGETSDPEKVEELLLSEIERLRREGIPERLFNACKNVLYGEEITEMENIESIATGAAAAQMKGYSYFDSLDALASVTLRDMDEALRRWLSRERMVRTVILPKGGKEND